MKEESELDVIEYCNEVLIKDFDIDFNEFLKRIKKNISSENYDKLQELNIEEVASLFAFRRKEEFLLKGFSMSQELKDKISDELRNVKNYDFDEIVKSFIDSMQRISFLNKCPKETKEKDYTKFQIELNSRLRDLYINEIIKRVAPSNFVNEDKEEVNKFPAKDISMYSSVEEQRVKLKNYFSLYGKMGLNIKRDIKVEESKSKISMMIDEIQEKLPFGDWEYNDDVGMSEYWINFNDYIYISVSNDGSGFSLYKNEKSEESICDTLSCLGNYFDYYDVYELIDNYQKKL